MYAAFYFPNEKIVAVWRENGYIERNIKIHIWKKKLVGKGEKARNRKPFPRWAMCIHARMMMRSSGCLSVGEGSAFKMSYEGQGSWASWPTAFEFMPFSCSLVQVHLILKKLTLFLFLATCPETQEPENFSGCSGIQTNTFNAKERWKLAQVTQVMETEWRF